MVGAYKRNAISWCHADCSLSIVMEASNEFSCSLYSALFSTGCHKTGHFFFHSQKTITMVINVPILVNCSSEFTQGGCKIISTLKAYEATCWLTLILSSFKTVGILLFDALIALIVEPVHAIYQGLPLSIRQLNVIISTRLML